jgi:hypothetical protein
MGITKSTGVRFNYDHNKQKWIVETPMAMNTMQLERILNNAKAQIGLRIQGEIGPKRKRMELAHRRMTVQNVEQWLVGNEEKTLYLGAGQKL